MAFGFQASLDNGSALKLSCHVKVLLLTRICIFSRFLSHTHMLVYDGPIRASFLGYLLPVESPALLEPSRLVSLLQLDVLRPQGNFRKKKAEPKTMTCQKCLEIGERWMLRIVETHDIAAA